MHASQFTTSCSKQRNSETHPAVAMLVCTSGTPARIKCWQIRRRGIRNAPRAHVSACAYVDESEAFNRLRDLLDVSTAALEGAGQYGRGLVGPTSGLPKRSTILSIPLENTLIVSDDPVGSLSIFGALPPDLEVAAMSPTAPSPLYLTANHD